MKKRLMEGIVKRHPDGFGFFISDDPEQPDVYIPRHDMNGIMTNDRVAIEVFPESGGTGRFRGHVVRIVSRALKKVVGRFQRLNDTTAVVIDESHAWGANLKIDSALTGGAKPGELVAVEVLTYPDESHDFTGRVVSVIGDVMDPLNDIKRVLHTQMIPVDFSQETLRQAKSLGEEVRPNDFQNRKDLRHLDFITIDGVTAKDFDDAVYVETNDRGFHLWVAIADVSHYVKPGTAIDEDAYQRGTSVYFPNYVVPMLPEALSNELCSLKPKVPRLTLVSEMQITFTGELESYTFYEAVIESKARVTYGQAQEAIDGSTPEPIRHVEKAILRASDLAKLLMARRFREGSLDLEVPETEMEIDAAGNPVDMIRSERLFSHRLIEELMLIANVSVARFFRDRDVPGIYRVHEEPDSDAIATLQRFLYNFGGTRVVAGGNLQKKISRALDAFAGKPQSEILHILTLRTMKQAKYSANNIGHFGLGFADYTHFTSPIRRYPDLIAHRLIKALLQIKGYRLMAEDDLQSACTMLSACEQRSVKAERQFLAIKKARFLKTRVGEEFDGIISGVAKFGVFVLLRLFDVDGLIKIENLGKERFEFDDENLRLLGARTGKAYSIGDPIRIIVARVDIEAGQIDFVLAQEQPHVQIQTSQRPPPPAKTKHSKEPLIRQIKASTSRGIHFGNDRKRKTNRKDSAKRGPHEDDHRGVRKARLSKRRRKN